MAVVAEVHAAGYVDPPGRAAMLQYQLVVVDIIFHPFEQQSGYLFLGGIAEGPRTAGDGDVGGLALHVLGSIGTVEGLVEVDAAEARVHTDGQIEVTSRRFETAHAEVLQSRDMALQWRVVDVVLLGGL